MKKILYILSILPLFSSCLLEYPETTPDGEIGIDPTSVTLRTSITADFRMDNDETDYRHETIEYRHRITVAAFLDRKPVAVQTVYEDLSDNGIIRTDVSLSLHAKEYRIAVWADIVGDDTTEPYYDLSDLTGIIYGKSYRSHTVYKDALCGSANIDLTGYRDEWGAKESMEIELSRPMGKYEIIATDVEKFLAEYSPSKENSYEIRLNYNGYIPAGYNVLDGITKNAFNYLTYSRSISGIPAGTTEFPMIFDYLFMDKDETVVPVTIEVRNIKQTVVAKSNVDIKIKKNAKTVIRGNFLTTMPGDGIGIDTEFEEKEDIDLGVI